MRIKAARNAADLLITQAKWEESSTLLCDAITLLPSLSPRSLQQCDQQHILEKFSGLATFAASVALQAGKGAFRALQLLELGRGVIAGLRYGTRTDLTDLGEQHPEMVRKFERLQEILEAPVPSTLHPAVVDNAQTLLSGSNSRHDASLEFEKIINIIRCQPNFENFLLPPRETELRAAASAGPVVLINVSHVRCDAILLATNAVRWLPLPLLSYTIIEENVEFLKSVRNHTSRSYLDGKNQMSHMLEWLWDAIAHPILDALGFQEPPLDKKWPHVWWIPTGILGLLPLHAAGRYSSMSTETVLDRVVSSYCPSIKALIYARQNTKKNDLNLISGKILLTSMQTTPSCSDIQFARKEIEIVANLLPALATKVKLEQPCKEDVVSCLKDCTIFHFAGHGRSDSLDPSKSCLLLDDWQENPLTVESLSTLQLYQNPPFLAYLSACSTGENQAEYLHDEAIHLMSACQLAGFRHIVGSLWEVSDQYCIYAAREVYKALGNGESFNDEAIALGVHNAARFLRDITRDKDGTREWDLLGHGKKGSNEQGDPLTWAAYVHFGA